ncbi:MAG TPA: type II toxin-antitoxin system VapC family toxin [Thermoanaerobaculia bacterium]|nr:type II toxin-antitoxin system VapC family toxin [Thermoanaerobaculia bacterium]
MIALDTNVIVRLVTADDSGQLKAARAVFEVGDLWVCKTVFLETEWVLRYSYELSRPAIREVFRKLLGYPRLQVEDRGAVLRALTLYDQGLDFADALHLASSGDADRFATFDQPFAKRARSLEVGLVVVLLQSKAV